MPTPPTLTIQIDNNSDSSNIWAYVTGRAVDHNFDLALLKSNGTDLYYPQSPSSILQPLTADCAIPLGKPGNKISVTIPHIAGGRIWFSRDNKLTFLLNPGPALVEPSVLNPSDPNSKVDFSFAEFTYNSEQLYANITYVDFVSRLPVSLTLQTATGAVQHVSGMLPDGLDQVCAGLKAQTVRDKWPWEKLIVQNNGVNLRALNPTHGAAVGAKFDGYFEPLVEAAWRRYAAPQPTMRINTQAAAGIVPGNINSQGQLAVGQEVFGKPNTADILGCNTGPFTTGPSATRNAIIPRIAAAFQRGCIVEVADHPSVPETFYKPDVSNHYSRIVHECNVDKKGYAFAYDDVQPDGGEDQSGKVNAGDPTVFIIAVGGKGAYAGNTMP